MIDQIEARLMAFKIAKLPALDAIDFDQARNRVALAGQAVARASPATSCWWPKSRREGRRRPSSVQEALSMRVSCTLTTE